MSSPRARREAQTADALARGLEALMSLGPEGRYEGEMRWCAMLSAQYVLAHELTGRTLPDERRAQLLRYFEHTRGTHGVYGLHDHAGPSLFVTTLVYAAARALGADADAPWLAPARQLFETEDVLGIPTWGRVWLALLGAYEWDGIHPMPAWIWALPESLPIHPSRYYCHTRMIYLAVSLLRTERPEARETPLRRALRAELYPGRVYRALPFTASRSRVSPLDRVGQEHPLLRAAYGAFALSETITRPGAFADLRARLREHVRFELRSSAHLGVSPVNGLLGALALHAADPSDPEIDRVFQQLERWVFDDEAGARVTGARSETWDTAFALRALHAARQAGADIPEHHLAAARDALTDQQVIAALPEHARYYRTDPRGGFCFSTHDHGWPVSDCSAEALVALLESPRAPLDERRATDAVGFILRCQNVDGSFGSYEARRTEVPLEALNPSEMFLECMVEGSYVECTGSCLEALARYQQAHPTGPYARAAERASERARAWLVQHQRPDGSWTAAWGVHFIYGTLFAVRGLRAAGALPEDPHIVRALRFLMAQQRPDGGFGEHEQSAFEDRYVSLPEGHCVQTAWALLAMAEGGSTCAREARERAARFLVSRQRADGSWPRERMVGVFFRTALVDYDLYRAYFPVWALAVHAAHPAAGTHAAPPAPR
ncbi:MAG: prenyltransferase/squalene oxidase repeat-containing protein [Polyangiales bacterium]